MLFAWTHCSWIVTLVAMDRKTPGLFVTGTNTEVGKTYVSAVIVRPLVTMGYAVGVYKPIATGCRRENGELISDDAVELWQAAGCPGSLNNVCPQRFEAPLAPHLAAQRMGRDINGELLRSGLRVWQEASEIVLVEGAGGLMSPVAKNEYVIDLAEEFGYPLVIVAPNSLGVINQVLQTIFTARFRSGLTVAAVVLNDLRPQPADLSQDSNYAELQARCGVRIVAQLRYAGTEIEPTIDWYSLARQ